MADNTATTKGVRLGAALREAREDKGFKLRELARELGIDSALLSRWETGKRVPKETDVARILAHLGINGERYEEILAMVTGVAATQWLAISLPEQRQQNAALIDFESAADVIVEVAPLLIPGLLQTGAYARAVMSGGTVPNDEISTRVATRLGRREVVSVERAEPATLVAYIGEAALRQLVGSADVMIEQLNYLLKVAEWPHMDIRVLPYRSGWHPGLEGPFTLIEPRGGRGSFPIVFLENRRSGLILHAEEDVAAYRQAVDVVLQAAMTSAKSSEVIADVIKEMRTG